VPDYQFTFTVQDITPQRATAIRDRLSQRLNDDNVQVQNLGFARRTTRYRIVGVDTADKTTFDQTTEAVDQDTAIQQIVGTSTTRVVALAQPA
jgi:hypothetical protein